MKFFFGLLLIGYEKLVQSWYWYMILNINTIQKKTTIADCLAKNKDFKSAKLYHRGATSEYRIHFSHYHIPQHCLFLKKKLNFWFY